MTPIGLFYGSDTGFTELVTSLIKEEFDTVTSDLITVHNIAETPVEKMPRIVKLLSSGWPSALTMAMLTLSPSLVEKPVARALARLVDLNHRYALDGSDPSPPLAYNVRLVDLQKALEALDGVEISGSGEIVARVSYSTIDGEVTNTEMHHVVARRGTRQHRYYRCSASMKRGARTCPVRSIRAADLESFTLDRYWLPEEFDAYPTAWREPIIAAYHDQALIPLKLSGFGGATNVTAGLPFIRTSPDHGTAYEIARKGIADATAMKTAIEMAVRLQSGKILGQ